MLAEEHEKQSYSGMERFLFFVTPLLFTLVLVLVLLVVFNPSLRSRLMDTGRSIPVVGSLIPESQSASGAPVQDNGDAQRKQIAGLQGDLQAAKGRLQAAEAEKASLEKEINGLQDKLDQLIKSDEQKKLSASEYQAKITELAGMFSSMTPSKAAPIIQNMTLEEAVLVLNSMDSRSQGAILAKMDPKQAAGTAARLKDSVPVQDQQIAALQSRIRQASSAAPSSGSALLSEDQLSKTFESMDPAKAAQLLMAMSDVSASKVLRILGSVSDSKRSSIVQEMSGLDKKLTSQLVSKLMAGK